MAQGSGFLGSGGQSQFGVGRPSRRGGLRNREPVEMEVDEGVSLVMKKGLVVLVWMKVRILVVVKVLVVISLLE